MKIPLTCTGCHKKFDVPENLAGKKIRCTACQETLMVPAAGSPKAAALAEELPEDDVKPLRPSRRFDDDDGGEDERRERGRRPRKRSSRDSGNSKRAALIGVGAIVGLFVVAAAGILMYQAFAGKGTTPGGDGGKAAEAAGWHLVEDRYFSVRVPTAPMHSSLPGYESWTIPPGDKKEIFTVMRFAPGVMPGENANAGASPEATLEAVEKLFDERILGLSDKAKIKTNVTIIDHGGFPGRDFTVNLTEKGKGLIQFNGEAMLVTRFVVANNRLFCLMLAAEGMKAGDNRIRLFFDSLKFKEMPSGPGTTPTPPATSGPPPVTRPSIPNPPITRPSPPPSSTPSTPPADEWQAVAGADGFELEMPGPVTRSGIAGSKNGTWTLNWGGEIFSIHTQSYSITGLDPLELAARPYRSNSVRGAEGMGLRFSSESNISLNGIPGTQFLFDSMDGQKHAVVRQFIVNKRRFAILAAGPTIGPDDARTKRFLDSFKITESPDNPPIVAMPTPNRPPFGMPGTRPAPMTPSEPPETNLKLVTRIEPFWAIAFAPEKGEVFTIAGRVAGNKPAGMLRRYSYPDFKLKGSYNLPNLASKAVYDEKSGLLYVTALTKPETLVAQRLDFDRAFGDGFVQIFDLKPVLAGQTQERDDLKPTGTVLVSGRPVAIELAADGKMLYCLSEFEMKGVRGGYTARLLQVDTAKRAVAKELSLSEPTRDMTWSADGRRLYLTEWPVGANNVPVPGKSVGVAVIDPIAWTKLPTLPLPGFTMDLTASPSGKLIAAIAGGRLASLDTNGGVAVEVKSMGRPGASAAQYVRLTPDGKRLVVSSAYGQGGVDVCDVEGTELRRVACAVPTNDFPLSGHFRMSPDGSVAVFRTGAVLDVANAGK